MSHSACQRVVSQSWQSPSTQYGFPTISRDLATVGVERNQKPDYMDLGLICNCNLEF